MPLETATYVPDLVTSNPAHSDGLNQADAHIRLIKGTLKSTFPNFTDVALNSTQAAIDATVTTVSTTGVSVLADAGVGFKTNTGDKITNPAAGEIDVQSAKFVKASGVTSLTLDGGLGATGPITGPGTVPIGGMIMWLSDTLPTNTYGKWCWANGGTLSRTIAGAGLELFNIIGTTYGTGDGSTTFNVINMQEVAPVGKSTMGGASSPGLLTSIATGLKTILNGLFGGSTQLAAGQIPTITSSGSMSGSSSGSISGSANGVILANTSGAGIGGGGAFGVGGNAGVTGSYSGSASVSGSVTSTNTGGGSPTAVPTVTPSRAVNFIIRYA